MTETSTKEHIRVLQAYEKKMRIEKEMRDWPLSFGGNTVEEKTNSIG